jgi:hypothetical protein
MDQELPLLLKDLGGSKLAEVVHSFSAFGLDEDKYWKVCNARMASFPCAHVPPKPMHYLVRPPSQDYEAALSANRKTQNTVPLVSWYRVPLKAVR